MSTASPVLSWFGRIALLNRVHVMVVCGLITIVTGSTVAVGCPSLVTCLFGPAVITRTVLQLVESDDVQLTDCIVAMMPLTFIVWPVAAGDACAITSVGARTTATTTAHLASMFMTAHLRLCTVTVGVPCCRTRRSHQRTSDTRVCLVK